MDTRDRLLALIETLYAAPGSAERWQTFLLDLCTALDGSAASFIAHNLTSQDAGISLMARMDPAVLPAYAEHWGRLDPWVHSEKARDLTTGVVGTGEQLISRSDLRRTAYYNDFAQHHGLTQALAGMIEATPDRLSFISINGADSRAPFAEQDVALLEALMPHLQRALQIHRRLVTAEAIAHRAGEALDHVHHAVLIVDRSGRLIQANRVAGLLLAERDGVFLDRGEVRAAQPADTARLRHLLAGCVETSLGSGLRAGGRLAFGRPSGRRPLQVLVSPFSGNRIFLGPEPAAAMIFITDPECHLPSEHDIRTLLGLTPAEARLACSLAEGLDIAQAAQRLGLAIGTLRTRLKTIFEKTGTHRQAELISVILAGPRSRD